jgi:hypothetical protein
MGPPENRTPHPAKQADRHRRDAPRARRCLLKGCERRFHPENARQRYCSDECRAAARDWSGWKARQTYRATAAGKQKRKGQSRRYRKRVKERKPPEKAAVPEPARVIGRDFFSRGAATGPAAMNASCARGGRHCNGSARRPAGVRWSAFGSGSGAGGGDTPGAAIFLEGGPGRGSRERRTSPAMSLTY